LFFSPWRLNPNLNPGNMPPWEALKTPVIAGNVSIQIMRGETANINKLEISLNNVQYDEISKVYKVSASIAEQGFNPLIISEQDPIPGTIYNYKASKWYQIRVVGADEKSAYFSISLKNPTP